MWILINRLIQFGTLQAGDEQPSNEPDKMKRVLEGVQFHHKGSNPGENHTIPDGGVHHFTSHELDAKAMRTILTQLFAKTLETKNKQKETPHHHYDGTYREISNIDRPPVLEPIDYKDLFAMSEEKLTSTTTTKSPPTTTTTSEPSKARRESGEEIISTTPDSATQDPKQSSSEVFEDVLSRLQSLGSRGKTVLRKLMDEMGPEENEESEVIRNMISQVIETDENMTDGERDRKRRQIILSSPLNQELNQDDSEGDAALEEVQYSHSNQECSSRRINDRSILGA